MGYIEGLVVLLVEDATVRLASCFIRCVLNYGQHIEPFLCFYDERWMCSFTRGNLRVHAVVLEQRVDGLLAIGTDIRS